MAQLDYESDAGEGAVHTITVITSYTGDALIRVFSARDGKIAPAGSYNAEDVIQNMKPKLNRLFDWQK